MDVCCGIWDLQWIMGQVVPEPSHGLCWILFSFPSFSLSNHFMVISHQEFGWYVSRIKTLYMRIFWNFNGENERKIKFWNQSPLSAQPLLHSVLACCLLNQGIVFQVGLLHLHMRLVCKEFKNYVLIRLSTGNCKAKCVFVLGLDLFLLSWMSAFFLNPLCLSLYGKKPPTGR